MYSVCVVVHKRGVDLALTIPVSAQHTPPTEELSFKLQEKVTAIEGTGSATRQYSGIITEIDSDEEYYIVSCQGVRGYKHGYNMRVSFSDVNSRINQLLPSKRRRMPPEKFY